MTQHQYLTTLRKQVSEQRTALNQMENILVDKFMEAAKIYGRAPNVSQGGNYDTSKLQLESISAMSASAQAIVLLEQRQDQLSAQIGQIMDGLRLTKEEGGEEPLPQEEEASVPPQEEPLPDNVIATDFSNVREQVSYGEES